MATEVNLNSAKPKDARELVVNLTNTETGEKRTLKYEVKPLANSAGLQSQVLLAEFARDKIRDNLVGSYMMKEIFAGVTPVDDAPELASLLDEVADDEIEALFKALTEAATGSSIE